MHSIAGKIYPFEVVSDLVSTDTQCDFQRFQAGDFLTKGRIETRAALFDHSEMKGRHVGDRLNMIVAGRVGVGSAVEIVVVARDGCHVVEFNCLRKGGAEVRIGGAAIPHIPASVYVQVHQIRETLNS